MSDFTIKSRYAGVLRWSLRASCGEPGCTDQQCRCSLCGEPIGIPEDDPRWEGHPDECDDPEGCVLCRDQVPIIMFRGEGKLTAAARLHMACFRKVAHFRAGIQGGKA